MHELSCYRLAVLLSCFMVFATPRAHASTPCSESVATAVSIEGIVEVRQRQDSDWKPLKLDAPLCPGDQVRVSENSRAALNLANETLMRLDRLTTVTLTRIQPQSSSLLDLLRGAAHFISRVPKSLTINTPFVNGGVEGTEFVIRTTDQGTLITVLEGTVRAENARGQLTLQRGQTAFTPPASAPLFQIHAKPLDAVEWTLHTPLLSTLPLSQAELKAANELSIVDRSQQHAKEGNFSAALAELKSLSPNIQSKLGLYHASLLLAVGRAQDALILLESGVLPIPQKGEAAALSAIAALVNNDLSHAHTKISDALRLSADSAVTHIAHSLILQAGFNLDAAESAARQALHLSPENSDALLRLAELRLMHNDLASAGSYIAQAKQHSAHIQQQAYALTLEGFSLLLSHKLKQAEATFLDAIEKANAAPLTRLGLGLTQIRQGRLSAGRKNLEIAVLLDPARSIFRSYLGRAYAHEQRVKLASEELKMAKQLDPLDPTPWLYDGLMDAEQNRPVSALFNLQESMLRNDNRAVYRSRLLLDQDNATRLSDQATLYDALGFDRLALLGNVKAIEHDPGSFSALRSMAVGFASQPRSEIARVSSLLQAQLQQPANANPAKESLMEADLSAVHTATTGAATFNDYEGLFAGNRFSVYGDALFGSHNTNGSEVSLAGVKEGLAFHARRFAYQADGFRSNNQRERISRTLFAQADLSPASSLQLEVRDRDLRSGDLELRFDPDNFSDSLSDNHQSDSIRLSMRHQLTPALQLLGTLVRQNVDIVQTDAVPGLSIATEQDLRGLSAEVQFIYRANPLNIQGGYRRYSADESTTTETDFGFPCPLPDGCTEENQQSVDQQSIYLYSQLAVTDRLDLALGASATRHDNDAASKENRIHPKIGATFKVTERGSLRFAAFNTQRQNLIGEQTLEPVVIAGFNQFYDDPEAARSSSLAAAYDHRFSRSLFGGISLLERDLDIPTFDTFSATTSYPAWSESTLTAYLYWLPSHRLALSTQLSREKFNRDEENVGTENLLDLETYRLAVKSTFFHTSGATARLTASYIDQQGNFLDPLLFPPASESGGDHFWMFDAALRIPLAQRKATLIFEGKNLANARFRYQEMDRRNPTIHPERSVFAKLVLAF